MAEAAGRFDDLCARAARGMTVFSRFLNLQEQRDALIAVRKAGVAAAFYGGSADCERKMLGAGETAPGETEFPIACLLISPRGARFAGEMTHRDVLGSLMALGVGREVIGDIAAREGSAHVFCESRMADFLIGALDKVGGTCVSVSLSAPPDGALRRTTRTRVLAPSPRADAVIARLYHVSRSDAQALFRQGRVFLDDAPCARPDAVIRENQVLSARGYGRARYVGVDGQSKKGGLYLVFEAYS